MSGTKVRDHGHAGLDDECKVMLPAMATVHVLNVFQGGVFQEVVAETPASPS